MKKQIVNIDLLKKQIKVALPRQKILYLTSNTSWSGMPENAGALMFFEGLHESGEWDFAQEKIDNQYGLNVFNYYMIKRRKKALVYKGGKYD